MKPSDDEEPWLLLGRILPKSIRHKIFEPAMLDHRLELALKGIDGGRLRHQVFVLLDSLRVGLPRLIWRSATRRSGLRLVGLVMFGLVLVAAALRWTHVL